MNDYEEWLNEMGRKLWFSCPAFTVEIKVSEGKVSSAAPIARCFVGQPLDNMIKWAEKKFGKDKVCVKDMGNV